MESTSASSVYSAGMIETRDAEPAGGFGGHRAADGDDGLLQQVGGLLGAEGRREVAHAGGAGEGHDVHLAVEQHPVEIGIALGIEIRRQRAIRDHVGDLGAGGPEGLGQPFASHIGARQQEVLARHFLERVERGDDAVGLEVRRDQIHLHRVAHQPVAG